MSISVKPFVGVLLLAGLNSAIAAEIKSSEAPLGIKLGVAVDQGFGVAAQFDNKVNAFIGNDGLSADYLLKKGAFHSEVPVNWYVGVGGVLNWNNSFNTYAARVPLGVSIPFAKGWDVYGQVAPALRLKNKHNDTNFEFGVDLALGIRYGF